MPPSPTRSGRLNRRSGIMKKCLTASSSKRDENGESGTDGKTKKPSVPRGIVAIPDIQGGYTKWQYRFVALLIKCFVTNAQCQDAGLVTLSQYSTIPKEFFRWWSLEFFKYTWIQP